MRIVNCVNQEENATASTSSQELETAILKTRETLRTLKKQVSIGHGFPCSFNLVYLIF